MRKVLEPGDLRHPALGLVRPALPQQLNCVGIHDLLKDPSPVVFLRDLFPYARADRG